MTIKATYTNNPYLYISVGDLITQEQLDRMTAKTPEDEQEGWEVVGNRNGCIRLDFTDLDGTRADWFMDGMDYWRVELVPTFAGSKKFYLVARTSY